MSKFRHIILGSMLLGATFSAHAVSGDGLPSKKQTSLGMYLSAEEAYQQRSTSDNVVFIDVRTRAEVAFLGMPTVADANIPYMVVGDFDVWDEKKGTYKLAPNSNFLLAVEKLLESRGLNKDATIIVMCRSGSRSAKATNLLAEAGYGNVYTVVDGYEGDKAKEGDMKGQRVVNGWRNSGLPWSYHLDAGKMYDNFAN